MGQRMFSSLVLLQVVTMSSSVVMAQGVKRTATAAYSPATKATVTAKTPPAAEPVQLRLTRKYTFSPGYVQSLVRVSPHPDNRVLRVTLDSADFYRSSDIELDGADAAMSHFFNWTQLPAGHYDIVVTVYGPDGPRGQSRDILDVIGSPLAGRGD